MAHKMRIGEKAVPGWIRQILGTVTLKLGFKDAEEWGKRLTPSPADDTGQRGRRGYTNKQAERWRWAMVTLKAMLADPDCPPELREWLADWSQQRTKKSKDRDGKIEVRGLARDVYRQMKAHLDR
jgi:hypothetical protein